MKFVHEIEQFSQMVFKKALIVYKKKSITASACAREIIMHQS